MKTLLQIGQRIDLLNHWVGRIISWLVLIMVLVGVYNAVTRKLSQTIGVDLSSNAYIEGQWYMFSLVFLWGAAYTLKHGGHVRVDVIYSRISRRTQAWIDMLGTVLFLVPFCLVVLWISVPYASESWRVFEQSPDPGGLPRYLIKSAIPVAFSLLLLQAFSELIKQMAFLRGMLPDEEMTVREKIT